MLLPRLEAAGCTYTLLVTAYPAHAYDYANLAPLDGIDAIVVLGGDGSLMETVTGLLHRADGRRVPLALLPLGTGNGFAADVGCWRVAEAVDRLLRGEVVSVDVNRVRDEGSLDVCSVNVVALGLIGDVAVAAERCRWLGPSRYNLCGMWGLLKNERRAMRVEYTAADGSSAALDCPLVTAFVSHTQHFGKGLRVAPRAQLDDGLADLTLVADASRSRMLGLFAQLPLGAHTERPDAAVRQTQVRACSLAPGGGGGGGVVNIDGEMFAFTGALRVECQRRAFQLLAPASAVPVAAQQLGGVSER
jgi:diacylglycerol kinase (ATP)